MEFFDKFKGNNTNKQFFDVKTDDHSVDQEAINNDAQDAANEAIDGSTMHTEKDATMQEAESDASCSVNFDRNRECLHIKHSSDSGEYIDEDANEFYERISQKMNDDGNGNYLHNSKLSYISMSDASKVGKGRCVHVNKEEVE